MFCIYEILCIKCRYLVKSGRKWEKMFFGQYHHSIDDKNRLMIPRKMRDEAGVKLFIMKGYEGSISVYKASEFEKLEQKLESLSYTQKKYRDFIRGVLASACELDVDKAGRIQIPTYFMSKYNMGKDVMVIGAGNHFEIWNTDAYQAYEDNLDSTFESVAENLFSEE